jgi:hypothetical protein
MRYKQGYEEKILRRKVRSVPKDNKDGQKRARTEAVEQLKYDIRKLEADGWNVVGEIEPEFTWFGFGEVKSYSVLMERKEK